MIQAASPIPDRVKRLSLTEFFTLASGDCIQYSSHTMTFNVPGERHLIRIHRRSHASDQQVQVSKTEKRILADKK